MARPGTRVVLVSRKDRSWFASCERALKEQGIDSVEAYNCWSAELALKVDEGEAVVVDGDVLCEFVSEDRPGALLGLRPKLPVLIFDAEGLDEQKRSAATAYDALMLDGHDVDEIARRIDGVLSPR